MNTNSSVLVVPAPSAVTPTNAGTTLGNDIRDLKPLTPIPNGWAWFWGILITIVVLTSVVTAIRHWLKVKSIPPVIPIVPPHTRAKEKLREALALIGEPEPFCTAVSNTLRIYLEERFDFHAPERTTEEFLGELQNTTLLTPDQKQSLADFLQRCDLVKFARDEPTQMELEDLHNSAMRMVEETEPMPELPEDAAPIKSVAA